MTNEAMVQALRNVARKYEDKPIEKGETNITKMCNDVADRLERIINGNVGTRVHSIMCIDHDCGTLWDCTCSACNARLSNGLGDYCPYCGVKFTCELTEGKDF